jgi:purine-nucleoside phosphorylase
VILGSGFHKVAGAFQVRIEVSYAELPGFPQPTVAGHEGKLLIGTQGGTEVLLMSGRAHYYEGHTMEQVTFAVRALAAAGTRDLIVTNAAGGINKRFRRGDFMLLTDHINLMGVNPLRPTDSAGKKRSPDTSSAGGAVCRFVDLSCAYDPGLRRLLRQAARQCGVRLRSGVYLAVSGPSYETPAEIRAFARLGADAVGMSTVPEVIVARQCGLRVAGLSCITNLAAGLSREPLSHADVLATADRAGTKAANLFETFALLYGRA